MRARSLRARLLIGVLVLLAGGLVVSSALTYAALDRFLSRRIDQQLKDSRTPVLNELAKGEHFGGLRRSGRSVIPSGTYGELRRSSGRVVRYADDDRPVPELPTEAPGRETFLTVGSSDPGSDYRVLSTPLSDDGDVLLVALPLEEARDTLAQLLLVEALVAATVLALTGGLALWVVRVGLRPLGEIADTAGAIADGDLSHRVARAEPRTEVGRLGLALNAMLAQIEEAFAKRRESEQRLRQFVADASHELRTPLTSIRSYAEMFRRGAAERPEDLATAMRRIEEEAARMGMLVEDLLLLARLDQGRPLELKPVDLGRVVGDAVDDLRAVDPGRTVTLDAGEGVMVTGDEARLRQVVANLLTNARVHTPPGTPVHASLVTADGRAVIAVEDEGPGVEPEVAPRIFERFVRADPARTRTTGGTGLGLAIVDAIVRADGGSAHLEHRAPNGTRFVVELPLAPS